MKLIVALLLLVSTDSAPPDASAYLVTRGRVTVSDAGPNQLVIELDEFTQAAPKGDGRADHVFRFWAEAPLVGLELEDENASLEFRGDELVVMSTAKARFLVLQVEGRHESFPVAPRGLTTYAKSGYALTHSIGTSTRSGKRPSQVIANPAHTPDPIGGTGGGGSCDAGGIGSTSCSTSNGKLTCSVSCASGYYACCKKGGVLSDPECKCVKQ
jgi:hypothetical protein